MMQRLTFPFPFVHHQTHDWLLSVLECHCVAASRNPERGLMMVQHFQDFFSLQPTIKERNNSGCKVRNVWKVEQLLTVETRTYLMMLLSFRFLFCIIKSVSSVSFLLCFCFFTGSAVELSFISKSLPIRYRNHSQSSVAHQRVTAVLGFTFL